MFRRFLLPEFYAYNNSFRFLRSKTPRVQLSEETFQVQLDLKEYTIDELSVKAHPDYFVVEGKQEKDTESGLMIRQFTRKFKLPKGCNPKKIQSKFSPDGVLTITAMRSSLDLDACDTIEVPINGESKMRGRRLKEHKVYPPYCTRYNKVIAKPPTAILPDTKPKDNTSKDNISKDNTSKDNISKDNIPKDNTSKDNISKNNTSNVGKPKK